MRALLVGGMLACAMMPVAAGADVKTGVDAWQQGDYARAVGEWRPLAVAGDPDAQFNLGQAYKLGRGVATDLPVAMEWFRKASLQGHLRAADNYGLLMFQQGQREAAMPYIRKSADRGEPRSQYILGTAMFNGDLAAKDWVMAYALMTRAAAAGLEQATTSLGAMDKYIPDDERKKGLALATRLEQKGKDAQLAAAAAPPVNVAKPVPVKTPAKRMASVEVAAAPVSPKARPAPAAPQSDRDDVAVAKPVPSKPRPEKVAAVSVAVAAPSSGAWRVQMGAFREEGRATSLWQTIKGRVSGMSAYQPYLVRGGEVTRLQAGPVRSEDAASSLCGKLKASGYDCVVKRM